VSPRAEIPPELAIDDPSVAGLPGPARLVWRVQIGVRRGLVDARTGELLSLARIDEQAFDLDVATRPATTRSAATSRTRPSPRRRPRPA
jgi:hypothetical protein